MAARACIRYMAERCASPAAAVAEGEGQKRYENWLQAPNGERARRSGAGAKLDGWTACVFDLMLIKQPQEKGSVCVATPFGASSRRARHPNYEPDAAFGP